jgi:hypothetical protein
MANTAARRMLTGWVLWVWSAPLLIGGMVFTELASIRTIEDVLLIIGVGAVSHLALGGVLILSRVTLLTARVREQGGPGRVLSVLVIAGASRGGTIALGFGLVGVGNDVSWWVRILTSSLLITVSFLYTAYSFELWRQYVERRRELLATIATQETAVGRQEIATDAYRELVLHGVEEDILEAKNQTSRAIDTIAERIESGHISGEELETLFGESDRAWRDVSHRAWTGSHADVPRMTLRELAITLMGSKPEWLIMFWFTALYGLLRVLGPEMGIGPALPIFGTILAGQLVTGWLVNLMSSAGAPWNQMSFGAGLAVLVVWPLGVATWWGLDPALFTAVGWLAVIALFFSLFLGLPKALARSGEAVLAQLEKRVDESALSQLRTQGEMFVLAQKVGAYLHGPLRSQFLQLSMELRAALEKADPFEVSSALSKLRNVVNGLGGEVEKTLDVRDFLANWAALISIDTNVEDVHIPARIHDRVVTVVTEAVNNAVRHGSATRVGVFFRYRPEGLLVEVIGAPIGTNSPGDAGLGAHILDDIAPGMWFHDVTDDGRYRLRVTIKTAAG